MTGQPLPGGHVNVVLRVGDTVRRQPTDRGEFVHELLVWLEGHGWPGAPRYLGTDEEGLEILAFLDGLVPWEPPLPAYVTAEASLVRVAELVRELHDLTAGTALADGREVVCHNDLSPKNTVYRDLGAGLRPVAFLDWDLAAPGTRLHDIGHVCWQYLGLGPAIDDVAGAGDRLRVICDAYGFLDRSEVVEAVMWWQDRCWRGIDTAAAGGDLAMVRLRDGGASAVIRSSFEWVREHRRELAGRL